jgi:hypothetical protein
MIGERAVRSRKCIKVREGGQFVFQDHGHEGRRDTDSSATDFAGKRRISPSRKEMKHTQCKELDSRIQLNTHRTSVVVYVKRGQLHGG